MTTSAGKATVKLICRAFELSRQAYYAAKKALGRGASAPASRPVKADTAAIIEAAKGIVGANPAWGVRKVWATLRREGTVVGYRRLWALMKANGLTLTPDAPREKNKPRGRVVTDLPNRRWAMDLTTAWTKADGLLAITVLVDSGCRSVLGIQVSKSQESHVVLRPLLDALVRQFGHRGNVPDGLELRTDHGPQFTGDTCHRVCEAWGLDHTFAPVGRPTGNALAERTIRTMKEECLWLRDWESLAELEDALAAWARSFNEKRPHQALGWLTPTERRAKLLILPAAAPAREEAA
ncbi:MAG: IS3 family transposase [Candidatus Sericytochromatia bacterium]|nr:IS3 family transposase [Candidatus Sericytochromatia bacterium]